MAQQYIGKEYIGCLKLFRRSHRINCIIHSGNCDKCYWVIWDYSRGLQVGCDMKEGLQECLKVVK